MNSSAEPAWGSALGIVAILLGLLLTAWGANEFLKFATVGAPPFTVATMPEPACEGDELAEEELSLAECRQLAFAVHDVSVSSPEWFMIFHMAVSAVSAILAAVSVVIGIALVDYRRFAPTAAVLIFVALGILDVVWFIGVVNTGPLIRQMYLWSILVWCFIHGAMAIAAIAGRSGAPANAMTGNSPEQQSA